MADTRYLVDVLQLLVAAVIFVPVFQRLRLGPVLGYFVAGAAIGPSGLGLVAEVNVLRSLAELGIVFLLFTIGLELTLEKLKGFGSGKFALGAAQVVVTGAAAGALTYAFGMGSVAAICRHAFPEQRLIVRAATEQAMIDLRKLGVSVAIQESTEIGLRLAGAVLEHGER